MTLILCDGTWIQDPSTGAVGCSVPITVVSQSDLGLSAMSIDDAVELSGHTLVLFAIVFGVLVVKKVLHF